MTNPPTNTTTTTTTSRRRSHSSSSSSSQQAPSPTSSSASSATTTTTTNKKRKRESCGRPRKEQQAYIFESYTTLVNAASSLQQQQQQQQQLCVDGNDSSDHPQQPLEEIEQELEQLNHHNHHHHINNHSHVGSDEDGDDLDGDHGMMIIDVNEFYQELITSKYDKYFEKEEKLLEQQQQQLTIPSVIICQYSSSSHRQQQQQFEENDDNDNDHENDGGDGDDGDDIKSNKRRKMENISSSSPNQQQHQHQQQRKPSFSSQLMNECHGMRFMDPLQLYRSNYNNHRLHRLFGNIMSFSYQNERQYQKLMSKNHDSSSLSGGGSGIPYIEQFLHRYQREQQVLSHEIHTRESGMRRQREEHLAAQRRARAQSAPQSTKDIFRRCQKLRSLYLELALAAAQKYNNNSNNHGMVTAVAVETVGEQQDLMLLSGNEVMRGQNKRRRRRRMTHEDKSSMNLVIQSEIEAFWRRHEKAQVERVKKASREEAERREKERQDRKLNFLLTQTELYSHFMAKKSGGGSTLSSSSPSSTVDIDRSELIVQELQDDEFESAKQRALKASSAERERLDHFSDGASSSDRPSMEIITEPKGFHGKLKRYQFQALNWLVNLYDQGINGMLCDEMGLGKTVQTIAFLTYINNVHKPKYPFLIITPTTTLHNWLSEFGKFSPHLKVLPYWGNTQQRKILRAGIKNEEYNVILSSYGMIIEDFKTLSKFKFHFLVLDEAHAIKSSESVRWKRLLELDVRGRMLLTGTPIQNHLGELWALLHFVMPKLFDNRSEFEDWFTPEGVKGKKKNLNKVELDEMQLQRLHMILRPFMLRRLKNEVESELAPKEELVLYCEVNKTQKEAYIDIRNTVVSHRKALSKTNTRALLNTVMQLRKICNHPFLFRDGEKEIPKQFLDFSPNHQIRGLDFSSPFVFKVPLSFREADPLVLPSMRNPIKFDLPATVYWEMMSETAPIESHRFCREAARELPYTIPIDTVSFIRRQCNGGDDNAAKLLNEMNNEIVERVSRRFIPRVHELVSAKVVSPPIEEHCSVIRHSIQTQSILKPVFVEHRNVLRQPEVWHFVAQCSKMRLLDGILNQLRIDPNPEGGLPNKVLIFCQMTRMLDLLEKYCTMRNYSFMRMDGSTPVQVREGFVQQFQNIEDRTFIFLLSTRAGGIGINLTRANHVIFYDCDWNPTLDAQAMDRVHRIGQKRKVTVMRLVNKNTVEERILQIAGLKMDIQSMVYKGSKADKDDIDVRQLLLMDLDSQL